MSYPRFVSVDCQRAPLTPSRNGTFSQGNHFLRQFRRHWFLNGKLIFHGMNMKSDHKTELKVLDQRSRIFYCRFVIQITSMWLLNKLSWSCRLFCFRLSSCLHLCSAAAISLSFASSAACFNWACRLDEKWWMQYFENVSGEVAAQPPKKTFLSHKSP